jgi:hypothetical protein
VSLAKRSITALVALACLVPVGAASQAAGSRRVETKPYYAPGSVTGSPVVIVVGADGKYGFGGDLFGAKRGERYVKISVTDQSGTRPAAEISLDRNGDGTNEVIEFCGTSKTLRLGKARGFGVFVLASPCAGGAPAPVTAGEIKAVFTK